MLINQYINKNIIYPNPLQRLASKFNSFFGGFDRLATDFTDVGA